MFQAVIHTCQWCRQQTVGNRKFCSRDCRRQAHESKSPDPSPAEIREMCRRIREEGGEAWERSHTCYAPQPFRLRVVATRSLFSSALEE